MKPRTFTRGLAVAAGVVTIILTAAAFALSYEHLARVAMGNGVTHPVAAWAWPGTVDLFIIAGEILILRAVLQGRKDWFAVMLATVGSVGSIALNVLGVGQGHPVMHYVVAGVPPVAALLAFGAVMRQIHEYVSGQVADTADTQADTPGQVTALPYVPADMAPALADMYEDLADLVAKTPDIVAEEEAAMAGQAAAEADTSQVGGVDEDTHQPTRNASVPDIDELQDAAKVIEADGRPVNGTSLAAHFGVSGRTGRRYADRLKADRAGADSKPDMATV